MPSVLNAAAAVTCSHAATVRHAPTQVRVLVGGSPVLVQTDSSAIVGCPFTIPTGKPSPCVTVRWTVAAIRVLAGGTPVLLASSVGLGMSPEQAPQGPPIVMAVQPRVQAI
jgi:hypothetical protein